MGEGLCKCFSVVCVYVVCLLCRTAGPEVKKACEFLLAHQMEDGGWGEDFTVHT